MPEAFGLWDTGVRDTHHGWCRYRLRLLCDEVLVAGGGRCRRPRSALSALFALASSVSPSGSGHPESLRQCVTVDQVAWKLQARLGGSEAVGMTGVQPLCWRKMGWKRCSRC